MARRKIRVKRKGYWRKGYTRADGTRVKRTWVPPTTFAVADRGRPGRGPKVIRIRKEGALGGSGYAEKSAQARRRILSRSVRNSSYATTARRVAALRGFGKRTMSAHDLRVLKQDQEWLKRKYGSRRRKKR